MKQAFIKNPANNILDQSKVPSFLLQKHWFSFFSKIPDPFDMAPLSPIIDLWAISRNRDTRTWGGGGGPHTFLEGRCVKNLPQVEEGKAHQERGGRAFEVLF